MIIQTLPSGPFETNAYIAACSSTLTGAIIDPGVDSYDAIISFLKDHEIKPDKILITHSHWDHIGDAAKLKNNLQIPLYIHSKDVPNLQNPGTDGLPCWDTIPGTEPDVLIQETDSISIGNLSFRVIHTPGHSPGGVCFYCEKENVLFSGDTLFKGSIGNLSFSTAQPDLMWPSLNKLAILPPQTAVYPGHGPSTTIGAEPWLSNAENIFGS